MDEDADSAIHRARLIVTEYLFLEPHIMKASEIKPDVLEMIHTILETWPPRLEKLKETLALVDDDLVRSVCAAGNPEDCRQKVREYVAAGSTCPLISSHRWESRRHDTCFLRRLLSRDDPWGQGEEWPIP